MAISPEEVLLEVGERLARPSSNKDVIVKLLKQAAGALTELRPSSYLENKLRLFNNSLIQHHLLNHRDKDVKLLIGFCFIQVMRVVAPNPPYSDDDLKVVFRLLITSFGELVDVSSPYFARRAEMLETFSALRCCILMLDVGCEDQVLEMFRIFFSVIREDHQQTLYQAMAMIISHIMEEKITQPLLNMILSNLRKKGKDVNPSFKLAVLVVQNCADKLAPFVWDFLTSSRHRASSKISYHDIILELAQCAPQMLDPAIPKLTQELMTDQVDVRIKAIDLIGKLFRLPGCAFAKKYQKLFEEFLTRFNDKSAEVRIAAIDCARACYLFSPTGLEASELLSAVDRRLLDYDDKVRGRAVSVLCDLVRCKIRHVQPDIVSHIQDRLRDKKISVRKMAMQRLLELYRNYCIQSLEIIEHFEQIPSKILALCYDKDCTDFRPQSMELVLAEDLFPAALSVERRSKHWLSFYSFFFSPHVKALNIILSQKKRLQMEMQSYLALRKLGKEHNSEEVCWKILHSFKKMSTAFVDPSKAVESFQNLHHSKDNNIFKTLLLLVGEDASFTTCQTIRDGLLKRLGVKHPHYEFLKILSGKCSFNIVSAEQVKCILLECLSRRRTGNLQTTSMDLLVNVVSMFPFLLRGSEKHLLEYILEEDAVSADFLELLAKAGHCISIKLSDLYPYLEFACLKGTRLQSKRSVAAISAIAGVSLQPTFSELYSKLVDFLKAGKNVPTVLQSLGCIAQHSWVTFSAREEEIVAFICRKFLSPSEADAPEVNKWFASDDCCSPSCKMIIYGLKTLVRICLPSEGAASKRHLGKILDILLKLLPEGDTSDSFRLSENDKAHIRLAAAKAVLRLARKWDLYICPKVFHLALMRARDPCSHVRCKYIAKVHELLKKRAIPIHYACNFVLAASDCSSAVRADFMEYLVDFIKDYSREARVQQMHAVNNSEQTTMTYYPDYIVVYLVHFLAHDVGFPSEHCQDQEVFARLCSPLVIFLNAFFISNGDDEHKNEVSETGSFLLRIFCAIKKAEDAVDIQVTHKLHFLADICMLIVKALCLDIKLVPNANRTILLPSSLYKVGRDKKSDEAVYAFFRRHSLESFIKKVINESELRVVKENIPQSKPTKKARDYATQVERAKREKKELTLRNEDVLILNSCREDKENAHAQSLRELSNNEDHRFITDRLGEVAGPAIGSRVPCDDKLSPEISDEDDLRKDQDSSCGSVVTLPSIPGSQNFLSGAILRTNDPESLEYCKNSDTVYNLSGERRGVEDLNQELFARRFTLLSSADKRCNTCDVNQFELGPHKELKFTRRQRKALHQQVTSPLRHAENLGRKRSLSSKTQMNLLLIDDNETGVGVDSESPTKAPKHSIASGSKLTCEDINLK